MATNILLESGTNEVEILEFVVGGNHYGINVAKIQEIVGDCEIQKIPHAKPFMEGVFRRRGKIYSAINLAEYLNLEENYAKDLFLITNFNQVEAAFRVDEIKAIHHLSWTDIQEPDLILTGEESNLVTGIAKLGEDEMLLILDFEKMLFDINPDTGIDEDAVRGMEKSPHEGVSILVAEDSALLQRMLTECLEKAGFRITVLGNGRAAWDKLQEYRGEDLRENVSCIITDIEMPQMDGLTLTRQIKEDPELSVLPVIVFSSMINEDMSRKCTQVGANAQLTKPDIVKLVACIDELLSA